MLRQKLAQAFIAALVFVVDMSSLIQDTGRQVDWTFVTGAFKRGSFKVKLAEEVTAGETSVDIDALGQDLLTGAEIDFGTYTPVTITVAVAGAAQGAVTVPVAALTGPIPKDTLIHLGGAKYLRTTAAAIKTAVSLAVVALPTALVSGDTGTFIGGRNILRLAADALAGVTNITVAPPQFTLADDSEGYADSIDYQGALDPFNRDRYFIPAGTIMVEVDPTTNRKMIPLAIHPDGINATGQTMLALTDMKTGSRTDALTGYGVTFGGIFYENLLPDALNNAGVLPAGWKTLLGSRYVWKKHRDSRGA